MSLWALLDAGAIFLEGTQGLAPNSELISPALSLLYSPPPPPAFHAHDCIIHAQTYKCYTIYV